MTDPDDFKTDPAEHEAPEFWLSKRADVRALVFWWTRALTGTLAEQGAMMRCLDEHLRVYAEDVERAEWLGRLRDRLWPIYAARCEEVMDGVTYD